MPATALAPFQVVEQPTFRAQIVKYVAYACRQGHVKRADFDDLVQQIWTEVAMSITSFRPELGTFENWVRGIALNVIRHHVRDKERYAKRFSEHRSGMVEPAAREPSPERCAQRNQAKIAISEAMESLSPQQVDVLLLHIVDDVSHGEIAKIVGISESASQKCFQRTRNKLAECLSSELLSAMPPFMTSCNEPTSSETVPRWHELSHYSGQIVAAVLAFLVFIPPNHAPLSHASVTGKIPFNGWMTQNAAMYHYDKHSDVHDEPAVLRDAPTSKPEAAPLPSVSAVSVPTRVGDKPTHIPEADPLPPFKHTPRSFDHQQLGR